jgi:hypothetical protein
MTVASSQALKTSSLLGTLMLSSLGYGRWRQAHRYLAVLALQHSAATQDQEDAAYTTFGCLVPWETRSKEVI